MTALSYLLNMGGTQNKHLIKISKEIWGYLIERKIHLTAEYIPSLSNQTADWASRNFQDSSEWKLCPTVFKQICSHLGKPLLDLFASRLCHQLPRYTTWRPDPQSVATDAFQQDWKYQFLYAFPPFSMIGRVLRKVQKDQTNMIIVTPAWQSQSWYPILLKMTIKNPILIPNHPKVLLSPEGKTHSLIQNLSLRLVALLVSGSLSSKGISKRAIDLISNARRTGSQSNFESAWRKWVGCCQRKQTDPFSNHLREVLDFLTEIFELGFEYNTINTHRSTISTFLHPIEGFSVGKHPKVCNLMAGVYNKRPPKPRYCFVWDVETVLRYLKSLPVNKLLSTKMLTLKLTMLLTLTSALKMF